MKAIARKIMAWAFQGRPDGVIVLMTHAQYERWRFWDKNFCELRNSDPRFIGPIKPPQVTSIGRQTRAAIEARSGGKCELRNPGCTRVAQDIHHVHFKSNGGTNEMENLLHTCYSCHRAVHQAVIKESKVKWTLSEKMAMAIQWPKKMLRRFDKPLTK